MMKKSKMALKAVLLSMSFCAVSGIFFTVNSALAQESLPQEIKDFLQKDFARADLDGDGVIGKAEIAATAEREFRDMDTNADGVLTSADHPADIDPRRLIRGELEHDANGDGVVTLAEFSVGIIRMAEAMDTDRNGKITLAEIHTHHTKLWNTKPKSEKDDPR